jgi:hypothetical protein
VPCQVCLTREITSPRREAVLLVVLRLLRAGSVTRSGSASRSVQGTPASVPALRSLTQRHAIRRRARRHAAGGRAGSSPDDVPGVRNLQPLGRVEHPPTSGPVILVQPSRNRRLAPGRAAPGSRRDPPGSGHGERVTDGTGISARPVAGSRCRCRCRCRCRSSSYEIVD